MTTHNPVAIVTGGAKGIGAAVARQLVGGGATVIIADVDVEALKSATVEIGCGGINADVATEAGVAKLVALATEHFGRLDWVVANAAINPRAPLAELSLEDWNRALAVNLTQTFLLARHAEAALRAAKGAFVTIASTRAHMSEPGTLAYSASKGGLLALTHALAMTLAPDVRVNCVSPGWIDTGRFGALRPEDHAQHPVGRVGRPDDVAAAVAFLLSPEAGFLTGSEIVIDGGMTRKMIYV
jgi:hypothetical protein